MPYKDPPKSGRRVGRPTVTEAEKQARFERRYPWATYLGGSWRRTQPKAPGVYPVASRTGRFCGYREFIDRAGRVVDALAGPNEPGWQGWIWSHALPEPPRAPEDWYTAAPCTEEIETEETIEA